MESPRNTHGLVLWESSEREHPAARVAIAGDFLPAGTLALPKGGSWRDAAGALAPCFGDVATTFANLECSIDTNGLAARRLLGLGTIVAAPAQALDYLAVIRAAAVGFANNHSYDFGRAGVERTRQALARRHLSLVGVSRNTKAAPDIYVWHGPGSMKVGFWTAAKASHDVADGNREGVEPATLDRARQAIEQIKSHGAGFCIALLHAGVLRTNRPDPVEVDLMDAIARAGFDVVAASHSHRISGYKRIVNERRAPAFCFYGLGSLVSGYVASPLEREGLVVVAGLDARGRLASLEVRPIWLPASGFGEVPSTDAARMILDRFQRLSLELADGSSRKRFYEEVSHNLVRLYLRDAGAAFRESGIHGLVLKAGRMRLRHLRRLAHGLLP